MTEPDPHRPTTAGPTPDVDGYAAASMASSAEDPSGGGATFGGSPGPAMTDERPELLVGAAFAGGIVAAILFKRLIGGRH